MYGVQEEMTVHREATSPTPSKMHEFGTSFPLVFAALIGSSNVAKCQCLVTDAISRLWTNALAAPSPVECVT